MYFYDPKGRLVKFDNMYFEQSTSLCCEVFSGLRMDFKWEEPVSMCCLMSQKSTIASVAKTMTQLHLVRKKHVAMQNAY